MPHSPVSIPVSLGKLWWATLLAFFLQATLVIVATSPDETTDYNQSGEVLQMEDDNMVKRDWNRNLNLWGKRGWSNLHGGWALKRSIPSILEENAYSAPPIVQKRSWQNFQNGWGKRLAPEYKDLTLQDIVSTLNENENPSLYETEVEPEIQNSKRANWSKFTDGWGKRSKWESFKGAWGKREPAWVNLKGLWGKRSESNSYVN